MTNATKIEKNLKQLQKNFSEETFIYDLLSAYGKPKATITRLKKGTSNLSKNENEIIYKKNLYFKEASEEDLHNIIDDLRKDEATYRHDPRFILVTDYKTLLAVDTKAEDTLDIEIKELAKHYAFFLPWAGMEKAQNQLENPADIKAAEKMAKLFDLIKKDNPSQDEKNIHTLNIFLSRILFCYFAEDTGIFPENLFSKNVESHTSEDGESVAQYLDRLFEVLNTPLAKISLNTPEYFKVFPYVNGGLFKEKIKSPMFHRQSRKMLIECGKGLDWSQINPDIFGSMMQAVVHPEQRSGMGMHYTSVPNIMKVVEALFLNELRQEFEKNKENKNKLENLLKKLENIKIFDPACGSGNFLIISYKELRRLEMKIFKKLQKLSPQSSLMLSRINLSQFYGIEIDNFAHDIAILSLWLAEHQMNVEFKAEFGQTNPSLPLKKGGNIVCGNATRLDWKEICPINQSKEIYLLGNPPYRGKKEQTNKQKEDLEYACGHLSSYRNLDFISCWFVKASQYINSTKVKCAFVSTNSVCQGEQVGLLWPYIYSQNIEIRFAYTSFMWKNNAKQNAGVAVVIIGIQCTGSEKEKNLYVTSKNNETQKLTTNKINPYLAKGSDIIIKKRSKPLSKIPEMKNGSMPNDDGNFFLDQSDYESLNPEVRSFYKKAIGAREFFHDINRYTLWIDKNNFKKASSYQEIKMIFEKVRSYREESSREATKKLADVPYRFGEVRYQPGDAIVVPGLSAESRTYIPIGFVSEDTIVTNLAQVIYEAEPWLFGLISSKINNIWVRATSGYFKKDIRYSPLLSYNTLPVPYINDDDKHVIASHVFGVLEERERYSEKTLAQLYDRDEMPDSLLEAHHNLDLTVERFFRSKPFESDEERLEYLFKLYEDMTEKEGDTCLI